MTLESSDLSVSLNVDQTAPVSPTDAVQGQRSSSGKDDRPRRQTPPQAGDNEAEPVARENGQPEHKIDSLA